MKIGSDFGDIRTAPFFCRKGACFFTKIDENVRKWYNFRMYIFMKYVDFCGWVKRYECVKNRVFGFVSHLNPLCRQSRALQEEKHRLYFACALHRSG